MPIVWIIFPCACAAPHALPIVAEMSEQGVSKNAQKKALKAQHNAMKKAEKDAAKKQQQQQQVKKQQDDEELDPTQYYANRVRALAEMQQQGVNPYPHKFHVSVSLPEYIAAYNGLEDGTRNEVRETCQKCMGNAWEMLGKCLGTER